MSVQQAAIQVIRETGRPLTAKEITDRILSQGLWRASGKTPTATVAARLYTDIKKLGGASPFVLVGPQTFALRDRTVEAPPAAAAPKKGSQVETYSL